MKPKKRFIQIGLLVLAGVLAYAGLVIGLSANTATGTVMWLTAGVIALATLVWMTGRKR